MKLKCKNCDHAANLNYDNGLAYCGHCGETWVFDRHSRQHNPVAHVSLKSDAMEITITIRLKSSDMASILHEIAERFIDIDIRGCKLHNISFSEVEENESF